MRDDGMRLCAYSSLVNQMTVCRCDHHPQSLWPLHLQSFVATSYHGNFGKRAGALCGMLGQCTVAARKDCPIEVNAVTGAFDSCTAEGIAGGASLPGVATGTGVYRPMNNGMSVLTPGVP